MGKVQKKMQVFRSSKLRTLPSKVSSRMFRVGQNRIYTPYMTVYFVISLPRIPYIHRIYMVLANPTYVPENSKKYLPGIAKVLKLTKDCTAVSVASLTYEGNVRVACCHTHPLLDHVVPSSTLLLI